jgi:signal transduction histidine kinase
VISRRLLIGAAGAGLAYGLVPEWFAAQLGAPVSDLAADLASGVVAIWCGLVAWRFRPADPTGKLLCLYGITWFFGSYGALPLPVVAQLMTAFQGYYILVLAVLVLLEGSGRINSWPARLLIAGILATLVARTMSRLFLLDPIAAFPGCSSGDPGCAPNPFLIAPNLPAFEAIERLVPWLFFIFALSALAIVSTRFARATGLRRRLMLPALLAAGVSLLALASDLLRRQGILQPDVFEVVKWLFHAGRIAIPLAFLLGVVERRMARLAVADLVMELGTAPPRDRLREALRHALGDPSLDVMVPDTSATHWLSSEGGGFSVTSVPSADRDRATTTLERDMRPIATIVHDSALREDPELVASVGAAVGLAIENERLTAELRTQLAEVRASRTRIVAAADAERARLERDIHDGAQQRLLALMIELRLARERVGADPREEIAARLDRSILDLRSATDELRELARGVRPAILADAGLGPAVRTLAERATFPVELAIDLAGRLDAAVESAAYFVVTESIANVVRHASATVARVAISMDQGGNRVVIEVIDDGVGGASIDSGSGIRGLKDRVEALGGQLALESPAGNGTRIRAVLPCAS